ncbi:RNA polymerase sigma-70 factor (sigma-E family) [Actinorugispora endophytica]|uniref:RNA polymerase sigma-70 factor (Sigma-E family) n=1 Tax=Actinorugispora endophytica TaxID=1605990 RepID=A0A4R6V919_9ACTN|nr:RNA polymerase sigma-70 factor (sigma-E family) [Actinorugispora endophytica]
MIESTCRNASRRYANRVGGRVDEATRQTRYEEFSDYVQRRGPALQRMALSLTGNHADAEDLLQAALVKTFFAWERISSPHARDGYVRRAMVNTQISEWRRKHLDVYPTDEIPEQRMDDPTWRTDLADAVGRAIRRLPDRQRLAVVLRYYEDMSEAEIASALGVSVGTVKSTVSRAVAKLRHDADLIIERTAP